jgi:hypothetical protein
VSEENRQALANWLVLAGAVLLFGSLFLTWSHQLPRELLVLFGTAEKLQGVPRDPTAWQVYSSADIALALLSAGLFWAAAAGTRRWRLVAFGVSFAGLVFVIGALVSPPQNALGRLFDPSNAVPQYMHVSPGAGVGETVALLALLLAVTGLGMNLAGEIDADRASAADPPAAGRVSLG